MKRIIIISLLLFFQTQAFSQAPAIQWQKSFGGSKSDAATHIEATIDGGYIVAAISSSNDGDVIGHHGTTSTSDAWILKLNNSGVIQWQKSLGGIGTEYANDIKQTPDKGYIIAATSFSNDGDVTGHHGVLTKADAWIVKLDSSGTIQWQKSLGGTLDDYASSIKETSDGNFILIGRSYSNDYDVSGHHGLSSQYDVWICKISNTGTILWQNSFGGSAPDTGIDILETNDGGYLAASVTLSPDGDIFGLHGERDIWILKLNSSGIIQWQKCLGGSTKDEVKGIKPTADNGFILSGNSDSYDGDLLGITKPGLDDSWIIKIDSIGSIQWSKLIGGSQYDYGKNIDVNSDGSFIIGNMSSSNDFDVSGHHGDSTAVDFWIVKTDALGTIEWQESYGGTLDEQLNDIKATSDGGYISVGYSFSSDFDLPFNNGLEDCWIMKLNGTVGIIETDDSELSVLVYPNPGSGVFYFKGLENESTIEICDISGRVTAKVFSQNNSCTIDLSESAKGIYFYKVINDKQEIQAGKVVLQ